MAGQVTAAGTMGCVSVIAAEWAVMVVALEVALALAAAFIAVAR
jgi:hypothetical protein